jgi:hypothetical protein
MKFKLVVIRNLYDQVLQLLQGCEDHKIDNVSVQLALLDNAEILQKEVDKIDKLIGKRLKGLEEKAWKLAEEKRKEFLEQIKPDDPVSEDISSEKPKLKISEEELEEKLKTFDFRFAKSLLSEKEQSEHEKLLEKHNNNLLTEKDISLVLIDPALLLKYSLPISFTAKFKPFLIQK